MNTGIVVLSEYSAHIYLTGVRSRNAFACDTLREIILRANALKKRRELIPPSFIPCLFASFVLTKVNGYTLGKLFRSKNLEKMKMWACSGIHDEILYPAGRSDGAFGPIYGVNSCNRVRE